MAQRRPLQVIRIQERGDRMIDLTRRGNDQVQASDQSKDLVRMCLRRHVRKNVFDARVRAPNDHDRPLRRVQNQRYLGHITEARSLRQRTDQVNMRRDIRELRPRVEPRRRPCRAMCW